MTLNSASDVVDTMYTWTVRGHSATLARLDQLTNWLEPRTHVRDDRGDVTPRTVGIAVMTAAAVGVGAFITEKITDKAATIDLDNGGITVGG